MKKKRIIYFLILIILISIIFLLDFLIRQNTGIQTTSEREFPKEELQQQEEYTDGTKAEEAQSIDMVLIPYPSNYNFAQDYNNCGPYNSAAVVRALTGDNVSSAEFAKTITHRIQYNWTLPEGLTEQLNQNGITTETPDLSLFTDEEKITYLKEQISSYHPVILLIKKDDFQHYITIFGYDSGKDEFYIYDSLMERLEGGLTKDENENLPGNKTISTNKLLEMWAGGGMLGMYEWLAIICGK